MDNRYFAEYKSALSSTHGCIHRFTPEGKSDQQFSPQVEHYCPLCDRRHEFRLDRIHMVSTKTQLESFIDWCETNRIQTGVVVK